MIKWRGLNWSQEDLEAYFDYEIKMAKCQTALQTARFFGERLGATNKHVSLYQEKHVQAFIELSDEAGENFCDRPVAQELMRRHMEKSSKMELKDFKPKLLPVSKLWKDVN